MSEISSLYLLNEQKNIEWNDVWLSVDCKAFKHEISFFSFQYIVLLILVFLLELSVGTLAFIYERNVPEELNMTLSDTFRRNYAVSERHTKAIDLMQQNFMCCGAVRFEEYRQSVWLKSKRTDLLRTIDERLVPDSCCVTVTDKCGLSDHPSNIPYTVRNKSMSEIEKIYWILFFHQGCIYKFSEELREQLIVLGSVGLGICITKIFGIVLACSLYIKLKKLYEQSANQTAANLMARDRVSFIYGIDESDDERLPDPPSSTNRNSFRPDFSESNVSNRPNSIYDRRV